jgi:plastocyanin
MLVALVLCAMLVLVLAGCGGTKTPAATSTGGGGSTAAGPVTIVEENFAFNPSSVTVKVGDTVTFENKDSAPHRVSIDGQDLGEQATGVKVEWKATKAGTFPFSCTIHPSMTGQVTVQ